MATAFSLDTFSAAPALHQARAVMNGLPTKALRDLLADPDISIADLAHVVAPRRTLDRRLKLEQPLTPEESDRLARFVRILDMTASLFGGRKDAMAWLSEPKMRFDGERPIDMLRSDPGAHAIETLLLQARHGMMAQLILWRISEFADLSGFGGTVAEGRWNSVGVPVVYTAGSSALAMLEVLAGLGMTPRSATFQLMRIEADDAIECARFPDPAAPAIDVSRRWGDRWLAEGRTAIAVAPSAIAPLSENWLINPAHRDAARVRVTETMRWPWDQRHFLG